MKGANETPATLMLVN